MTQTGITNDSTFCISNTCFVHVHPLHVHIQYICFAYPLLSLKRSNSFLLILCVGFKVVVVLSGYINDCLKEKRSIKVRPCDYLVRTAWLGPRIKIWLLREIWEGWGQGGGSRFLITCFVLGVWVILNSNSTICALPRTLFLLSSLHFLPSLISPKTFSYSFIFLCVIDRPEINKDVDWFQQRILFCPKIETQSDKTASEGKNYFISDAIFLLYSPRSEMHWQSRGKKKGSRLRYVGV